MKRKKHELTYREVEQLLAKQYNNYQNTNIFDSSYNYLDNELHEESTYTNNEDIENNLP